MINVTCSVSLGAPYIMLAAVGWGQQQAVNLSGWQPWLVQINCHISSAAHHNETPRQARLEKKGPSSSGEEGRQSAARGSYDICTRQPKDAFQTAFRAFCPLTPTVFLKLQKHRKIRNRLSSFQRTRILEQLLQLNSSSPKRRSNDQAGSAP